MEQHFKRAQDARDTRDAATYFYGVMQHMQNTYDSGAMVSNVNVHPKQMKLRKTDNYVVFLALKNP